VTSARLARALLLALAALAIAAPTALAATCPKTTVGDLEDEVMCPVCGTSLALATEAPQAERQRAFILRMVEQCRSKDAIKAALVTEFGPRVLAEPSDEGFGLAAYIVPVLVLGAAAVGLGIAAVRFRRRRPPPAGQMRSSGAVRSPDRDAEARLDADLARHGD
jgi:cytochrome c-type biogenesis protein CcmH